MRRTVSTTTAKNGVESVSEEDEDGDGIEAVGLGTV